MHRDRTISAAIGFALCLGLASSILAQTVGAPPSAAQSSAMEPSSLGYLLGIGDLVRISVYQQPDMTTETRVSERGTITVQVRGPESVGQLAEDLSGSAVGADLEAQGQHRSGFQPDDLGERVVEGKFPGEGDLALAETQAAGEFAVLDYRDGE